MFFNTKPPSQLIAMVLTCWLPSQMSLATQSNVSVHVLILREDVSSVAKSSALNVG